MKPSGLRLVQGGGAAMPDGPPAPAGLLQDLYERHAAQVLGRCRYLLRDEEEAKDALQEVFVKVLRSQAEFRAQASKATWMMRIATNHCLNLIRARRAQVHEQLRGLSKDRQQETEPPERRELVRVLLAAAPEEAQEIAVLYFVDELTQAEIAEACGRSLPTVRKRLREFLTAARAALQLALPGVSLPEGDGL